MPNASPTDLVVVLPGIMGSTLRHRGRPVWAPSTGAALRAITTFGRSLRDLTLPTDLGDAHPGDGVEPVTVMPDLHLLPGLWTPVRGYDLLLARLRALGYREGAPDPGAPPGNLLPVAYDWRLSNRYTGAWLARVVEPALERWRAQGGAYAEAQLVFVCHSMGGLVARWYVEHEGGAGHTRKVITLGTPYRGAARALEQLVNGVRRGLGPLSVDLTAFARSLPALHQLLPEYACVEQDGGDLAKLAEVTVPELSARHVEDALRFHAQLREAEAQRPASLAATHAIVGISQPTATTVRIAGGRVVCDDAYGAAGELYGDATVPLVAACRADVPLDSNTLRRVADRHGNLQRNRAALDELEGVLTAQPVLVRAPGEVELRLDAPELLLAGEPLPVAVTATEERRVALRVALFDEAGQLVESRVPRGAGGAVRTELDGLAPGAYTLEVSGLAPHVASVSGTVLVWPADEPSRP